VNDILRNAQIGWQQTRSTLNGIDTVILNFKLFIENINFMAQQCIKKLITIGLSGIKNTVIFCLMT